MADAPRVFWSNDAILMIDKMGRNSRQRVLEELGKEMGETGILGNTSVIRYPDGKYIFIFKMQSVGSGLHIAFEFDVKRNLVLVQSVSRDEPKNWQDLECLLHKSHAFQFESGFFKRGCPECEELKKQTQP